MNKFDFDVIREKWNLADLSKCDAIRVPEEAAREILLSNVTITIDGRVKAFSLQHIGLGVYKVRLSNFGVHAPGNHLIDVQDTNN